MTYRITYKDCTDETCYYQMINTIILNDENLVVFLKTHRKDILDIEPL